MDLSPKSSQSSDRCMYEKITESYGKCYREDSGICHRSLEKGIPIDFESLGKPPQRRCYLCWVLMHSLEFSELKTGDLGKIVEAERIRA